MSEIRRRVQGPAQIESPPIGDVDRQTCIAVVIVASNRFAYRHPAVVLENPGESRRKVEAPGPCPPPSVGMFATHVHPIQQPIEAENTARGPAAHLMRVEPACAVEEIVERCGLRFLSDDINGGRATMAPIK